MSEHFDVVVWTCGIILMIDTNLIANLNGEAMHETLVPVSTE
jgi:hypothetical protein